MNEERQTTETEQVSNGNGVRQTETVSRKSASTSNIAQNIVYYVGGAIIALLSVRLIFQLLGANQGSTFVDFVYGLSAVFVAPFFGIFGEPTFEKSQLETSTLVAIVIYAILTVGIAKLFTLNKTR